MDTSLIMQNFRLLSGLSEEASAEWLPLCVHAENDISASLKSSIDPQDYSDKLSYLAATLAFYRYSLSSASNPDSSNFTIGDIKLNSNPSLMCKSAEKLYHEAKAMSKSLLIDDTFYFGRCEI